MRTWIIIAACVFVAASACGGTLLEISDSEMQADHWVAFELSNGGGFSFTTGDAAMGGNPGSYRTITHDSATGFTFGSVAHLHTTAFQPSSNRAAISIDISIDVNCFDGGASEAVGFGLIVEQSGVVFFGPTFTALTASGWRTDLAGTGLTASDFADAAQTNPDFSAGGDPIRFGFFTSNGTGIALPIHSVSGADNFFVHVVPAPASALCSLLAPVSMLRRRRSSR